MKELKLCSLESCLTSLSSSSLSSFPISADKTGEDVVGRAVDAPRQERGCAMEHLFSPYTARVPWHTGPRAFLSKLIPRYGNYCGPNWSSGREHGSPLWDKHPLDSLDLCCFCHDMGYDTHDQFLLYHADLRFLHCLRTLSHQQPLSSSGNAFLAGFYRALCIFGLRTILIPYRRMIIGAYGLTFQTSPHHPLWKASTQDYQQTGF